MSFDGIMTRAVVHELNDTILNGKINKIYQPFDADLVFHIRAQRKTQKLYLSANPTYPRIHLTNESYENPKSPPMFCMLLRKHIEGSVVESIEQKGMERIIEITVQSINEVGDLTSKKIIVEIMGKHSNIVIVNIETNTIIDCIKHIPPSMNRYRTLLPGQPYQYPPDQGKANPLTITSDDFLRKLDLNRGKLDKQIVQLFDGISPLVAKEIVERGKLGNIDDLTNQFITVMNDIKAHHYESQLTKTDKKEYYSVLPLHHLKGRSTKFSSVSELLVRYFFGKAERDRIRQQANDLERFLKNELKKNEQKIKKLNRTLKDAGKAEKFQLYGELLTAHIYMVKPGDTEVTVTNYYSESGETLTIPLDPQKSPAQNAQQFYKKYTKLKNSVQFVEEQIRRAHEEIGYFETLIQQLESASTKDIAEIREELEEEGYLKRKKQKNSKKKQQQLKPKLEKYTSSNNIEIYVGKNNKQNDYLTKRFANSNDVWLHTKDIPGSHVVIKHDNPDVDTILEAANIAAYFSKAKNSSSVAVDYTEVKNVKKPKGAKPGFVTYDNQKTVFVTPNEDLVYRLKEND